VDIYYVGRKLLSERDENYQNVIATSLPLITLSEGNYSLKEMRTTAIVPKHFRYDFAVGRKLLSERDENVALP